MHEEKTILNGAIIITPLLAATSRFQEALAHAKTQLERDGTIQRFEFTYELLWKTLKRILAVKGVHENNPHDVFRTAAKNGLIDNPRFWFETIRKRNLVTHTYNQARADEIFGFLPEFEAELIRVLHKIERL